MSLREGELSGGENMSEGEMSYTRSVWELAEEN